MNIDNMIKQAKAYRETLTNPVMLILQGAKIYDLIQIKKSMDKVKKKPKNLNSK